MNYLLLLLLSCIEICHCSEYSSQQISDVITYIRDQGSKISLKDIHHFNPFDREKWVAKKASTIPNGATVLDVGAGECPYRKYFSHCKYQAHDFAQNKAHVAYGNLNYISDITAIPVADESFDVIICTEVFEHVPYPIEALKEIARILKPGGRLLLTAPLGCGLHQIPYHFYSGYTPEWYKMFCKKFNLKIVEISENGGFFKMLAQECARVGWTFDKHKYLHGKHDKIIFWLFNELLPRYLFQLDDKCFMNDFTIGYNVEAIKEK